MKGADPVTELLGGLVAFGWMFGLLVTIAFGGAIPLMIFFIMRHLKGIRRELSTLNETLQQRLTIR